MLIEEALSEITELTQKHPATHREKSGDPANARELQSPLQERCVKIRFSSGIVTCDVVGGLESVRALVGRIADDNVVAAVPHRAGKPHSGRQLLAVEPHTQIFKPR